LIQGKAIFEGFVSQASLSAVTVFRLCEIDQLFQIFRILGTPTDGEWQGFTQLPNFQNPIFPEWITVLKSSASFHR
jgi:hypothetical protein